MTSRFAQIDAELSELTGCNVCRWLRDSDREDADYITSLLRQPVKDKGHKHIRDVLEAGEVFDINEDQIRRHRDRHMR